MKKERLVKRLAKELEDDGYSLVIADKIHSCIDIFASKLNKKFTIKVMYNIDSIKKNEAKELRKIASFLDADPVIVGDISKNGALSRGVVYRRFEIASIEPDSIDEVGQESSYIASKAVGVKVMINSMQLRYLRKFNGLTINKLAKLANVSAATIYKHEKIDAYASLENVERLEQVLNSTIRSRMQNENIPTFETNSEAFANTKMKSIKVVNAPFNIIAKSKNYYEISYESNSRTTAKRATMFNSINKTFENNYPFFISNSKSGKVNGVPVINKHELNRISSEDELLNYLIAEYN